MYSVRKTTPQHGNANLNVLAYILIITTLLIWQFGINYLVIFCASSLLHILIETGLFVSGIRKGEVYVYGYKLPKTVEIILRSSVEGPAFCVPAFFIADQLQSGNFFSAFIGAFLVVGLAAFYLGWEDKRNIQKLGTNEEPLISRRAMTKPKAVMLLAMINTGCLIALFLIPNTDRLHAFSYLISYAFLVLLFYFINYNLGVRYIEMYDHENKHYFKPSKSMQIAGLTYDSAYEMALLISPAYWLTYYLNLFN